MVSRFFPAVVLMIFSSIVAISYAQEDKRPVSSPERDSAMTQTERPKYDEVYHAMVSDLVVVGEVVRVANLPGPSGELFHSEAIVRIDSVLKGEANFKTLILLRMSGPVTDKGIISHWSGDARFKVGERDIFFLHRPDRDNFLTAPYIQRGLYSLHRPPNKNDQLNYKTSFYGNKSLNELPDSVFWGDDKCKDVVKNGAVSYRWGTFKLGTVAKEIRTLRPSTDY